MIPFFVIDLNLLILSLDSPPFSRATNKQFFEYSNSILDSSLISYLLKSYMVVLYHLKNSPSFSFIKFGVPRFDMVMIPPLLIVFSK